MTRRNSKKYLKEGWVTGSLDLLFRGSFLYGISLLYHHFEKIHIIASNLYLQHQSLTAFLHILLLANIFICHSQLPPPPLPTNFKLDLFITTHSSYLPPTNIRSHPFIYFLLFYCRFPKDKSLPCTTTTSAFNLIWTQDDSKMLLFLSNRCSCSLIYFLLLRLHKSYNVKVCMHNK